MPKIYVSTYAKYNAGSLSGAWLDLEEYSDKETFLNACAELHSDEADPEFMFQDAEEVPEALYSESSIDNRLFEWLDLDDAEKELTTLYWNHVDQYAEIEHIQEQFHGCYASKEDWAYEFLNDTGALEDVPDNLKGYFDYGRYARDCELEGSMYFVREHGQVYVFNQY